MQSLEESNNIKKYINHYRCILDNFLTPLPLLDNMPDLNSRVYDAIANLHDRPSEQVDIFLTELEKSESPGTWQAFMDALNNSDDQKWLYILLKGEIPDDKIEKVFDYVTNADAMKKLFRLIKPELNGIDAHTCITELSPWLADGEKDCLLAKCRTSGNQYTLWWILSFITRKGPGWIKKFHEFVKNENYRSATEGTLAKLLLTYFDLDTDESEGSSNLLDLSSHQPTSSETFGNEVTRQNCAVAAEEQTFSSHYSEPGCEDMDVTESNMAVSTDETSGEKSEDAQPVLDTDLDAVDNLQNSDDKSQRRKEIKLRGYQKELVQLATEGKNVIICAPPGSGKTIMAAHIVSKYLENHNRRRKVLFFTPGGPLASQQKKRLEEFFVNDYTVSMCVGGFDGSSALEVTGTDVVVLTPQILLNILKSKEENKAIKSLDEFELLIFDECHHCMKGHPYNAVMREYFRIKNKQPQSDTELPQIVGLTATLGVGNSAKATDDAMLRLCANLDIMDGIVTVKDPSNRAELHIHIAQPEEVTQYLNANEENPFYCRAKGLLNQIGRFLEETGASSLISPIPVYEHTENKKQSYKTWCVNSKNEISQSNFPRGRDAISCIEYLEVLGDALDIQSKCRAKDAIQHIEDFADRLLSNSFSDMEKNLCSQTKDTVEHLMPLCNDPKCDNPNLKKIEKLLLETFKKKPDSKGMLMVQKRIYTRALKNWFHETESLRFLNAEIFTGSGNSNTAPGTGLSHKQQEATMDSFRKGQHKFLVCTPAAAGEGLDIVDCNIVINYDYIKSEIAMVQIKGRVRKRGGELHQFSSSRVAHHDQLNKQKTAIMEKATEKLQKSIDNDKVAFQKDLFEIQKKSKFEDQIALVRRLNKQPRNSNTEYLLRCRKCAIHVCSSFDIKLLDESKHVNPTPEFKEKYRAVEHRRIKPMGPDWKKKNKVVCKKCGCEWGIEAEWMGCITLPLIKIAGLTIVEENETKKKGFTPRHWKNAPFVPIKASLEDIFSELDSLSNSE